MNPEKPQYDFNNDVFRQNLKYRRWAREHLQLATMQSDVIRWEVAQTVSPLQIPVVYRIHYHLKSIVGIMEDLTPVYADHHILELSIPEQYPLEGCKIAMLTDVWHPNIRSEGKFKGRVCGNTDSFGLTYDLYQLVLRVGEILQYKNYHAVHVPPYPEDSIVAKWVIEFAEPNNIVDKSREIAVDDTPLVRMSASETSQAPETPTPARPVVVEEPPAPPEPTPEPEPIREPEPEPIPEPEPEPIREPEPIPEPEPAKPTPPPIGEPPSITIKIGSLRPSSEQKPKITITPKD